MFSGRLPAPTRAQLRRTALWLAACAALGVISRTLVHDIDARLGRIDALSLGSMDLYMPAAGIAPQPPPPAPRTGLEGLLIPVKGVEASELTRNFDSPRSGGRAHRAIDILARRNTPVIAAADGTIANLSTSTLGGIAIYQLDQSGRYAYYYAHLQRYADGLREGDRVARGQVIGYVGTSGNAPENIPHLHFAIMRLTPGESWRKGTPIDPYDALVPEDPAPSRMARR